MRTPVTEAYADGAEAAVKIMLDRAARALRDAKPINPQTSDFENGARIRWNICVEYMAWEFANFVPEFDPNAWRKSCGYE